MGARRSGRQAALQILFQIDTVAGSSRGESSGPSSVDASRLFFGHFEADPEGKDYAEAIVAGVCDDRDSIDARIERASVRWRITRMSRVDRNLLRMATWELLQGQASRAVIIDEAVELAKSFGNEDTPSFVNGVLEQIANQLGAQSGS